MAGAERVYCDHCESWVAKRTRRDHRQLQDREKQGLQSGSDSDEIDFEEPELCFKRVRLDFDGDSEEFLRFAEDIPDENNLAQQSNSVIDDTTNDFEMDSPSSSEANDSDSAPEVQDSDDEYLEDKVESQEPFFGPIGLVVKLFVVFLASWKAMCGISDTALSILLRFLGKSFKFTAEVFKSEKLREFSNIFPKTIFKLRTLIGSNRDNFEKYVVCGKCSSIYKPEDMLYTNGRGVTKAKKCNHVKFPNHPHSTQRRPCGQSLFKEVRMSNGKVALKAKKIYCLRSIKSALSGFLKRPNFEEKCNEWRKRNPDPETLSDVYDGKVWKDFKGPDGEWFFQNPFTYGCSVNLDWFQPFDKTQYSVGVLYLCMLNLPPEERYKEENVAIIGILPGPHEPSKNVNSFLEPTIDELQDLYSGTWVEIEDSSEVRFCSLAILCASCDIPASRKLAGFVGFGSCKGCNKCLKTFPCKAFREKNDYSGFDKECWLGRDSKQHREKAFLHKQAATKAEQKQIEKEFGIRYSCLCELPYFDSIRFVVIDPMHNLLLGTTKRMLKIWKNEGLLQEKDFKTLQHRVNEMSTPAGIGRLPLKIASGFAGFTADQFKNWNIIFSSYALTDVLPNEHLQTWKVFVRATSLLCKRNITKRDCALADQLLLKFCKSVEKLYGKDKITINMHLHCHLSECVLDFGPVYSFWCFSFERFNGILGSYHTNNHQIEVQLMRRFLENQQFSIIDLPDDLSSFKGLLTGSSLKGSLAAVERINNTEFQNSVRQMNTNGNNLFNVNFESCRWNKSLGRIKAKHLSDDEVEDMCSMYSRLHEPSSIKLVPQYYEEFNELLIGGELFGSSKSRNNRSSVVLARWHGKWGFDTDAVERRPGEIQHFLRHTIVIDEGQAKKTITYILAYVKWYKPHPHCRDYFGMPIQVCLQDYEMPSAATFIPVGRISHRCAAARVKYNLRTVNGNERVVIVVPLERQFNL